MLSGREEPACCGRLRSRGHGELSVVADIGERREKSAVSLLLMGTTTNSFFIAEDCALLGGGENETKNVCSLSFDMIFTMNTVFKAHVR